MNATLRINDKCNFGCRYCFTHLSNETVCEMNKETADEVLAFCIANDVKRVDIPQKEPLLSPEMLKYIIEHYTENGVKIGGITTNLYCLTDEIVKLLKKHKLFVLTSYDGIWHDEYRVLQDGTPTANHVRKNIEKLIKAGIPFNIACAVVHGTESRIYDNYKHLSSIHKGIVFNFDVSSPLAIQDLQTIESQFAKIANETLEIFPLNKIVRNIRSNHHYANHMCGAGRGSYTFDWDGWIYPCYHVPSWKAMGISIGNINDGINLQEKNKFRHYDTSKPEKCKNCESALCGICYAAAHDATGNMLQPIDINCRLFDMLTKVVRGTM